MQRVLRTQELAEWWKEGVTNLKICDDGIDEDWGGKGEPSIRHQMHDLHLHARVGEKGWCSTMMLRRISNFGKVK